VRWTWTIAARSIPAVGPALCLASAAAFGTLAVFGKLAYDAGVSAGTLLAVRFALAALLLGALLALRPRPRARLDRRTLRTALALGAVGYALQAGLFFAALERVHASLLTLLLYTYPAWVVVAGLALRRQAASARRLVALALSSAGLVLALAGAGAGALDPLGAALGVGAALTYAAYILVSDGVVARADPLALSAVVCTGAAASLALAALATGSLDLGFAPEGWLWLGLMAALSTVVAVVAFFAGLARVGPPTAAILSTFEPVVTVALATLLFGERLLPVQLAGAALVLAAAVLVVERRAAPAPVRAAHSTRRLLARVAAARRG
jgi:drug/metabolite transporter (DMT)-like permease